MKAWKKAGILCILIAILLSGFGLPEVVNAILDRQVNGNTETVNTESTQLQMSSDLTLTEKFLVMDRTTSSVNLNSAQSMEYEGACECLDQELSRLFPADTSDPFSIAGFAETDHAVTLFVYEEKSVLLWDFLLENESGDQIRVLLDDDSGLILSFSYEQGETETRTGGSDLFTVIADNTDLEPADYLDDLALRYVEYLQTSYRLSGTEISYEWTRDSADALMSGADNSGLSDVNSGSENISAGSESIETNKPDENSSSGSDEDDSAMDSDTSANNTASSSGTAGNRSIWSFDTNSKRADTAGSLWNYDGSEKETVDSDDDETVVIDEWYMYIHLTQNGEECVLDLNLDRSTLSVHSLG